LLELPDTIEDSTSLFSKKSVSSHNVRVVSEEVERDALEEMRVGYLLNGSL
jgi:hypothetical protein